MTDSDTNPAFDPRALSPSPAPQPPTASAPGPRASALEKIFNDALSHTLKACSYTNFAACFPTPARYVPESLTALHKEFVMKLEERCKSEFEALMEERNVVASLNDLDTLISDARIRKEAAEATAASTGEDVVHAEPPHLLPPNSLLSAHLVPFVASHSSRLNSRMDALRSNNQTLAEETAAQKSEIESLLGCLERFIRDIEAAAAVVSHDSLAHANTKFSSTL